MLSALLGSFAATVALLSVAEQKRPTTARNEWLRPRSSKLDFGHQAGLGLQIIVSQGLAQPENTEKHLGDLERPPKQAGLCKSPLT